MNRTGYLPRWLLVPAVIGLAFLLVPLTALIARVQWSTLVIDVTSDAAMSALALSLGTGATATIVCAVVGIQIGRAHV